MKRVLFGLFLLLAASPVGAAAPPSLTNGANFGGASTGTLAGAGMSLDLGTGAASFGAAGSPLLSLTPGTGGNWNNAQFYPVLNASGTVSDDAALQAAVNACSSVGGTVYLPPGRILLNGSAGTINLQNCRLVGAGQASVPYSHVGNSGGTEIDLTSRSVVPFTIGSGEEVEDVSFYWPDQTGAVVYPPLFQDEKRNVGVQFLFLLNDNVINVYIGLRSTTGWGPFWIEGGNYYAVHALFDWAGAQEDSGHITSVHMSPGLWENRCTAGAAACDEYIDTASLDNAVLRVETGGVWQNYISNSATFDWRYGILIEQGGTVSQSSFNIAWDGMGTLIDSSAATTAGGWTGNEMYTAGPSVCGEHWSVANGSADSYYPCFNMGPRSTLVLSGALGWGSYSDGVDMSGGALVLDSTAITIGNNGISSNDTYAIHGFSSHSIKIFDSTITGVPGSIYTQGIVETGNGTDLQIEGTTFVNLNQDVDASTASSTHIVNDIGLGTVGSVSVAFADANNGVWWGGNQFDKPPLATVSSCGAGATITGTISGNITVGSGTVTSCTITLPFNPPAGNSGPCLFGGLGTTIQAVPSGASPPVWLLTFGADSATDRLYYTCPGTD